MSRRRAENAPTQVKEYAVQEMRETQTPSNVSVWIRPSGVHPPQTTASFIGSMGSELLGCWLLGFLVTIVRWAANSDILILNAVIVGVTYGGAYKAATYLSPNHVFRRHLNPVVTLAYWIFGRIGFIAALFYWAAQFLGGMVLGGISAQVLLSASPHPGALTNIAVPYPTSVATVWSLPMNIPLAVIFQLIFTAVIVALLMIVEFVNTDPAKGEKNYKRATLVTAVAIVVVVSVLFNFQVYTFNPVVYGAGLFSGNLRADADVRSTLNLAQLRPALYPDSIWTGGSAWADGLLTPFAGGLLALAFVAIAFLLNGTSPREFSLAWAIPKGKKYLNMKDSEDPLPEIPSEQSQSLVQAVASSLMPGSSIQTQTLTHPSRKADLTRKLL